MNGCQCADCLSLFERDEHNTGSGHCWCTPTEVEPDVLVHRGYGMEAES